MGIFAVIESFLASNVGQELTHDLITGLLSELSKLLLHESSTVISQSQQKAVVERATGTP